MEWGCLESPDVLLWSSSQNPHLYEVQLVVVRGVLDVEPGGSSGPGTHLRGHARRAGVVGRSGQGPLRASPPHCRAAAQVRVVGKELQSCCLPLGCYKYKGTKLCCKFKNMKPGQARNVEWR